MSKVSTDKKEAILKSALELFIERGYHNTPTSLIAKEAGAATGTLFHHFANKEVLFNELYLSVKRRMIDGLKSGLDENRSLVEKIGYIWGYSLNWLIMHPKEFRFFQEFGHSPIISKITKEEAMDLFANIAEPIDELSNSGLIKEMYPEFIMDYFQGMMYTAVMHFLKHPDKFTDENISQTFDIFWNGLAK
jgi:AcrR family transcriptional regulator